MSTFRLNALLVLFLWPPICFLVDYLGSLCSGLPTLTEGERVNIVLTTFAVVYLVAREGW